MQEARGQTNWKFLAEVIGIICVAGAVGAWLFFAWQARINEKGTEQTTSAGLGNVKIFNGNNIPAENSGGSAKVKMTDNGSQASSRTSSSSTTSVGYNTNQTTTSSLAETVDSASDMDYSQYSDSGELLCNNCIADDKIIAVTKYGGDVRTIDIQNSGGEIYISFVNADLATHTDNMSVVDAGRVNGEWLTVNTLVGSKVMLKVSPIATGATGTVIVTSNDGKEFRFIINVI